MHHGTVTASLEYFSFTDVYGHTSGTFTATPIGKELFVILLRGKENKPGRGLHINWQMGMLGLKFRSF